MTPKEKAEDLFSVFCIYPLTKEYGQYLSLKAVDEIVKVIDYEHLIQYWQEVKQEIENL
jgi:hypothetical protein